MKKKILLTICAFVAFAAGYGAVTYAYPSGGVQGRAANRGFFTNALDNSGWEVLNVSCSNSGEYGPYNYNNGSTWCNAVPRDLNSPSEFFAFIEGRLANGVPNGSYGFGSGTYGDARARTGAAFLVHSMIGTPDGSRGRPPSAAQMNEWRDLVNQYSNAGRINWSTGAHSYSLNSYYQGTDDNTNPNDDAFYDSNRSGLAIVFYNASGGIEYAIRRECANPVGQGNIDKLDQLLNFNISGTSTENDADNFVMPGQVVAFTHNLSNAVGTGTGSTSINWSVRDTVNNVVTHSGNAGTFASGQTKNGVSVHNVTIPNLPPGSQVCRNIEWSPDMQNGGSGASTPACVTLAHDYNLTPSVNAVVTSGGVPIAGNVAEPGDTIAFTYAVNNSGSTESHTVTCTYRQQTYTGYNESPPTTLFTPGGANCPPSRIFPTGNSNTATEPSVAASTLNTTICRSLTITPVTVSAGVGSGTRTAQACVLVAAKPYSRVWGGDISVGNNLVNSGVCAPNNDAAIVGWNKRPVGSSAGAGVQFAAYAMARITDFATALYDPGGAPSPNGFSFANTSGNAANGDFGGGFGAAPCIPDYYATRPTSTSTIPATVAAMTSGVYGGSGNVTLGGGSIINPNNRITVYVDGNVYITSNITYSGSWDIDSIPLFELIVSGNIYIDNDVTQLDGVYVAQANSSGNNGIIHTCATGFADIATNTMYANCTRKLTVNGLFTARQIRLLRTIGTLSQSNTSEASTSPNVAETFNYGPALWIQQPVRQNQGATPDYDAILSLPPIL